MNWLIQQRRAVQLFFLLVMLGGYFSLLQLGREELPEPINEHDGVTVTAQLAGASPDQIDRLIARPVHQALKDIPGVQEVDSNASEGRFVARVRFKSKETDPGALSREISQRVNQLSEFPDTLKGPFVSGYRSRLWEDMTLVFSGGDELERHQQWRWIAETLRGIPDISELVVTGDRERRVEISLDGLQTAALGTRIDRVAAQLREALHEGAAGRMELAGDLHQLRVLTRPESADQLAQIPVRIGNSYRPLSMISQVRETLEPARVLIDDNDSAALYIQVYREPTSNIESLAASVRALAQGLNERFKRADQPYRLKIVTDRSTMVARSFAELRNSIALGICLVLMILWLAVGLRSAMYAAIGIPFAFLASFMVMSWLGLNLNLLTLFGLILVCGMVVDDTIVVLENVISKRESGADRLSALSEGLSEVAVPVLASTATTIAAFIPLLIMSGDLGLFLSSIPKVVIIALLASLVECFVILPVHLYGIKKVERPVLQPLLERAEERFVALSAKTLHRPWLALALLGCLLLSALYPMRQVTFSLAKGTEIRGLNFTVELPHNFDLQSTRAQLLQLRPSLQELDVFADIVFKSGWRHQTFANEIQPWLGSLQLALELEQRDLDTARAIAEQVQRIIQDGLPVGTAISLSLDQNKPPTEPPIVLRIYGSDTPSLVQANALLQSKLGSIAGVRNITDPLRGGMAERIFRVDHASARRYGFSPSEVTQLMHMAVTGIEIGDLDIGGEQVPVVVSALHGMKRPEAALSHISRENGAAVPLSNLGRFEEDVKPAAVRRLNDMRYVVIEAESDPGVIAPAQLQQVIAELVQELPMPAGTALVQDGDNAEIAESLRSMSVAAVLALGACYLLLTMVCRSYTQPLVLLACLPAALTGVFWGLWLFDLQLSILGIAGVIGLIGIVLNDALVWVDYYNRLRRETTSTAFDAAIDSVRRRYRPIVLTTTTTVLALLPAAISGAGVATEIARITVFGLCSASLALLVFLPVMMLVYDRLTVTLVSWRVGSATPIVTSAEQCQ